MTCLWFLFVGLIGFSASSQAQQSLSDFDAAQVVLSGLDPQFRGILDLSQDGVMDAIGMRISVGVRYVRLYRNDGTGVFSPIWDTSIPDPSNPYLHLPLATGDVNGDGQMDFLTGAGGALRAWRTYGFGPPSAMIPSSQGEIIDLDAIDLNNDGRDDVVALVRVTNIIPTVGIRTFYAPLVGDVWTSGGSLDTSGIGTSLATVRTLGGGLAVISIVNGQVWGVFGDFSQPSPSVPWTHVTFSPGFTVDLVTSGDIDSDGDVDAVLINNTVPSLAVLRQGPTGGLSAEAPSNGGPFEHLTDVDQDGDLDGVGSLGMASDPNVQPSEFVVAFNLGVGAFTPAVRIRGLGARRLAGATDLDGDGDTDLLGGRAVYFARRPLTKDPLPRLPANLSLGHVADLEADGDLDLDLRPAGFFQNVGPDSPTLRSLSVNGGGTLPAFGFVGDFDGDLDQDFLLPGPVLSRADFLGNLLVTLAPIASSPLVASLLPATLDLSVATDLDQDGDVDLVATATLGTDTVLAFNDGSGFFGSASVWTSQKFEGIGDVDGDSATDILVNDVGGGVVGFRRQQAPGVFGPVIALPIPASGTSRLLLSDLDADGDIDVITREFSTGAILAAINDGTGNFTFAGGLVPPQTGFASTMRLGLADLDRDGRPDLLLDAFILDQVACTKVYKATGPLTYAPSTTIAAELDSTLDLDGDARPDLFDRTSGAIHVCTNAALPLPGVYRQYGVGVAGEGGIVPLFGAKGPFFQGGLTLVRLRGGVGGGSTIMAFSSAPGLYVNNPLPTITLYLDVFSTQTLISPQLGLTGNPSTPGVGHFEFPVPIPMGIAGLDVHHQAVIFDPAAPIGLSATNAFQIIYGA